MSVENVYWYQKYDSLVDFLKTNEWDKQTFILFTVLVQKKVPHLDIDICDSSGISAIIYSVRFGKQYLDMLTDAHIQYRSPK